MIINFVNTLNWVALSKYYAGEEEKNSLKVSSKSIDILFGSWQIVHVVWRNVIVNELPVWSQSEIIEHLTAFAAYKFTTYAAS